MHCQMAAHTLAATMALGTIAGAAEEFPKPYSPPCVERENVFAFAAQPSVKVTGQDRYEVSFAVKGNCDVTVAVVDPSKDISGLGRGTVVRHLGSGVLGANAPAPFQKNSLKQTIIWDGKDDLGEYVRNPENLKVRVSLGLKPVFDKRLGATSGKFAPQEAVGIAIDANAAYVLFKHPFSTKGILKIRKFDRAGNYLKSLVPPPAELPETRLGGLGYVEYEPGKRAIQGAEVVMTVSRDGDVLGGDLAGKHSPLRFQPVLAGNRLIFCNSGATTPSRLRYIYTDGGTDLRGMAGRNFGPPKTGPHVRPTLAVSPDGQWLYMIGYGEHSAVSGDMDQRPFVARAATDGDGPAEVFLGKPEEVGSSHDRFNNPRGLDCDAQGRVYVSDHNNNRIQVFSPEGKHLKSIPCDRPTLLRVHQKTGAIYVIHAFRSEGQTRGRLTKLGSFDQAVDQAHVDDFKGSAIAVDSWSAKPRLWVADGNVSIWEEDGETFRRVADFQKDAMREAGEESPWWLAVGSGGGRADKIVCDPVRERLYFRNHIAVDLASGKRVERFLPALKAGGPRGHNDLCDDLAIDKRGYMHLHFNPGFYTAGVGRVDPSRRHPTQTEGWVGYPELPYDYGVEVDEPGRAGRSYDARWLGALPLRDQPGAQFFQRGIGVNMRGDVAVVSLIYYIPKMNDEAYQVAFGGGYEGGTGGSRESKFDLAGRSGHLYTRGGWERDIQERQRRGDEVYYVRREPGIRLSPGTVWTFEASGQLRQECAVLAGKTIDSVSIDEDGQLYFATPSPKMTGDMFFLQGRGGTFGSTKPAVPGNVNPLTLTYMKTRDRDVRMLYRDSPIPLDQLPARPPDLMDTNFPNLEYGQKQTYWVEGAKWLYAGVSPSSNLHCDCPMMRPHLDWYKRSYVPEAYRHSIGILDTNGNLIMHCGRYGNFDTAPGGQEGCRPGGDDIRMFIPRFVGGTDNYLAFEDWGERIVVLRLDYQAQEDAQIGRE